ncbi:Re/Si-specific NAD(P)(+) transhydrogenase subunit alpha [Oricola cellulosilytica]|uniref:proton-translocating NAD(P)(+) transhydrogenase n=1 Tax=Oricola cellulosilytica TaxID=1429082 RepID=A0A4R0P7B4_9HYPH|nr:Re/Si-specific NAD(P)(+) transhydrogenase subunit alpha [Oricola cellulosilytica]TCD11389.1 Re/Si-specific NAD(P)(+) transhydrogenase subunit alpha [Oricola cellulosilytica]
MSITIFVPRESGADEPRVAASPDSVKKLTGLGCSVLVERGAGEMSRISDEEYDKAGAKIAAASDIRKADVVLCVRRPDSRLSQIKKGAAILAIMDPFEADKELAAMAKAGVSAFAMELMPRITRAQVMDVLSSQANLAGYQAVIDAAHLYDRALPMMMTAAGTVPAAKAFVMGAGVAGLQAIATARRLGAAVTATDVRAAAGEQVQSLGAKFIMTDALKDASGEGGYARELTAEERKAQSELVASHIAKQDIVITTALIPGRPAPKLVTTAMIESMRPGAVIIDLAVERGGNVEGAKPDEVVTIGGVRVAGYLNMPGKIAASASLLYAKNLLAFLETMIDKEAGKLSIDRDDELVKATLLTHDGAIVHDRFGGSAPAKTVPSAKKASARKTPAKKTPAAKKAAAGAKKPDAGDATVKSEDKGA